MAGKHIVILTPGFPSSEDDKNCLPAQQALVLSFKQYYPELTITILSFEYPHSKSQYIWNGIKVIPFSGKNIGGLSRIFRWFKIWQTLNSFKKENAIDGIISFWAGQCALVGNLYGRYYKIPQVNWILGQDAKKGNRYTRLMSLNPKNFIAVSDFIAQTFQENYHVRPGMVVPNAILPELFTLKEQLRNIDIIGVGSLIPLKKFDLFIQIVSELIEIFPNINVKICGDGPEKDKLLDLIHSKNLGENITMTGELPHQEVFDLMQRSKILVHTSEYEGFSGVCLEALYAGAHVVSFHQPMEGWIRHWHVAENATEMKDRVSSLLLSNDMENSSILPYHMKDSADKMLSFLIQ